MPRFAANLSMLYTDSPFMDRFSRAKASGFQFVEYMSPYEHEIAELARNLRQHGLTQVLFNLPAGDWGAGDRGIAAHPDRIPEFRRGVTTAIKIAQALGVPQMNCLVGKRDGSIPLEEQRRVMVENLRHAAEELAKANIRLLIEMLNPFDVPGFLIASPRGAFAVQDEVRSPNLKIQYDVYHAQRTEGDLGRTIQANLERIGHMQIADNPGRHQPGTGEINYRFLLSFLDRVGYEGYIGVEYAPEGTTEQSLGWVREYGYTL
jgi:hydroxypyruvate isomerase